MKIAQVGNNFSSLPRIDYYSTQTFLEYDALIIDPAATYHHSDRRDIAFYQKRKENLIEFINYKKIPIIYLSPKQVKAPIVENGSFASVPLDRILPVPNLEIEAEKGKDFAVAQKTALSKFLSKYKSGFGYERFFKSKHGTTIATTHHTNKILGFYTDVYVFIPEIISIPADQKEFLIDLIESVRTIRFEAALNPLPKWADSYFLPQEQVVKQRIISLQQQINNLNEEIENSNRYIESLNEKKRLFTGTGNELELQVQSIFTDLGFEILESEQNRDDLIVKYKDDIAVVEIKGVNNSAGEKNAAQLEKWRATYLETNDVNPKGILLVNAYKDVPLERRDQPAFPDQMLRYSIGREHCLITTIQLLALYYETQKNPENKDTIIKSLFETVGRYPDTFKWQEYISIMPNEGEAQ